jgi:hypothetical protein
MHLFSMCIWLRTQIGKTTANKTTATRTIATVWKKQAAQAIVAALITCSEGKKARITHP